MADVTQQDIYNLMIAVKDARHDVIDVNGAAADRLQKDITDAEAKNLDRFYTLGRDTSDLRAQITALGYQLRDGFSSAAKDSEINFLKCQAVVVEDGGKTRAIIERNNSDWLNRSLIERNSELVEERHHARHWRGAFDQSMFNGVNSQIQALGNQVAEARQGMVNFGTMAGVGQTSTSNNVK